MMLQPAIEFDTETLPLLALVLTLWLVLILGSGFLVLKAASAPPPLALVLMLSVVTLVCIAGFIVSRDEVILQLASVGLGAIAAAVATTWSVQQHKDAEQIRERLRDVEKKEAEDAE